MTDPLIRVVATTLALPAEQVTETLAFNGVTSWDSMNHINLMLALEETFGIAITDDEVVELTTVGAIRRYLRDHGVSPSATSLA